MPSRYRIDTRQRIEGQFEGALRDIVVKQTMDKIRERTVKAVDKEIGSTFRMISQMLLSQRSNAASPPSQIRDYLPGAWPALAPRYKIEKRKRVGHSRWFVFGYRYPSREDLQSDELMLVDEFRALTPGRVLGVTGRSQVTVRRDKSGITIRMLPNLRFRTVNFEEQFADILSEYALNKLGNRIDRYRALVGPAFGYVMQERIPSILGQALRARR